MWFKGFEDAKFILWIVILLSKNYSSQIHPLYGIIFHIESYSVCAIWQWTALERCRWIAIPTLPVVQSKNSHTDATVMLHIPECSQCSRFIPTDVCYSPDWRIYKLYIHLFTRTHVDRYQTTYPSTYQPGIYEHLGYTSANIESTCA